MRLKKVLTLLLAGVMTVAMPAIACVSSPATLIVEATTNSETGANDDTNQGGSNTDDIEDNKDTEGENNTGNENKPTKPDSSGSSGGSSSSSKPAITPADDPEPEPEPAKSEAEIEAENLAKEKAAIAEEEARIAAEAARASELAALAAKATGIPMSVSVQATGENKTVGEYMNNAVTEVPGIPNATPVGQGGQVIINGIPSNQTFSVQKPLVVQVQSAQSQAAVLGGNVLNVASIQGSVSFETASVNFYMPGVTAGQSIQVYQLKDGVWNNVSVSEIREDHVVVDMTSYGTLAFIDVPVH